MLNGELYAMESAAAASLAARLRGVNLQAAMAAGPTGRGAGFQRFGSTAIVDIIGPMTKYDSWFTRLIGGCATTTVSAAVAAASRDDKVARIVLHIDSPGGESAGVGDLANVVREAIRRKPVHAFIEDLGASAAYWVASQSSRIFANSTAKVGSIGTFAVLYDLSEMAAKEGIRVHVVKAGDHKGSAYPGTRITDPQLAEFQRIVDQTNDVFVAGVAAGRRVPLATARKLADGRVHVGAAAQRLGLVDQIVPSMGHVLADNWQSGSRNQPRAAAADPIASWDQAIREKQARGLSTSAATAAVVREQPELHQAYLEAYNARARRK